MNKTAMWEVRFGIFGDTDNYDTRNIIAVDGDEAIEIAQKSLEGLVDPVELNGNITLTGLRLIARED